MQHILTPVYTSEIKPKGGQDICCLIGSLVVCGYYDGTSDRLFHNDGNDSIRFSSVSKWYAQYAPFSEPVQEDEKQPAKVNPDQFLPKFSPDFSDQKPIKKEFFLIGPYGGPLGSFGIGNLPIDIATKEALNWFESIPKDGSASEDCFIIYKEDSIPVQTIRWADFSTWFLLDPPESITPQNFKYGIAMVGSGGIVYPYSHTSETYEDAMLLIETMEKGIYLITIKN